MHKLKLGYMAINEDLSIPNLKRLSLIEKEKGNPGRNNFVIGWRCFIMFSDNEEMEGERVFKRWRVKTEEIVGEFDFN